MKEAEIRPPELWKEYQRLCEKDVESIFRGGSFIEISCPACSSRTSARQFEKKGFRYQKCGDCGTIFMNPRPELARFVAYYSEGESVHFWNEVLYPTVEAKRREKIFRPRVARIKERLLELQCAVPAKMVDIGCGYGTFLEEAQLGGLSAAPEGVEPTAAMVARCRAKGFQVHATILENAQELENRFDLAVSFEVLEHLYDPRVFIMKAREALRPGGLLLMTSLSGTGYDFRLLQESHDNLSPPYHINFLNPEAAQTLYHACGFSAVKIETPGKLDVDILCNRVKDCPQLLNDVLFASIYYGHQCLKDAFQEFLAANNLSSHMWIWARR